VLPFGRCIRTWHLGIKRRHLDRWVRLEAPPERAPTDPKTTSPTCFQAALARLMSEGMTKIRWLFDEAKKIRYTGSFGHMARYVAHVRSLARAREQPVAEPPVLAVKQRFPNT
jgi:hypothetical protein